MKFELKTKTARDIANRDQCKSVEEWIRKLAARRTIRVGDVCEFAVDARVDHNRWIADCECGGAEYVDPDEPIFFCFSCNNLAFNGKLRPVVFPTKKEMANIEKGLNLKNYYSWRKDEVNHGV